MAYGKTMEARKINQDPKCKCRHSVMTHIGDGYPGTKYRCEAMGCNCVDFTEANKTTQ